MSSLDDEYEQRNKRVRREMVASLIFSSIHKDFSQTGVMWPGIVAKVVDITDILLDRLDETWEEKNDL